MTIGFDGSRAFVKNRTGTENYSYELLRHLSLIDKQNNYLVYLRPNSAVDSHDWPENFHFKVINFARLWTQVGLSIETFIDRIDLLFVPAHTLPIFRKPSLKTVMTVHDLGSQYLPSAHQIKQRIYLKMITDLQMRSATKLIAVSHSTKEDLVTKAKVNKNRIEVIYEGVNREMFNPIPYVNLRDIMRRFDIEKNYYFLSVGTIQPRKNLIRLIRAFKGFLNILGSSQLESRSYYLVLVGDKGWMSEDIFELPKKLGIEENVKFLGRVKDEDLAALYTGAIALVYPSLFEGFGLPVLEAFACNCPVLASNGSSLPEVVGEAGLLVDPYSIEQIMEGMLKLTSNKNLRDNLIKEGTNRLSRFSWETCARETLKLFNSL